MAAPAARPAAQARSASDPAASAGRLAAEVCGPAGEEDADGTAALQAPSRPEVSATEDGNPPATESAGAN
jgi:hypothetical protein